MRPYFFIPALALLIAGCALLLWFTTRQLPAAKPLPSPAAPVEPAAVKPSAEPIPTAKPSDPILDLFNPSDETVSNQLNDTVNQQRLEEIIVTIFLLKHCNMVSPAEYNTMFEALYRYTLKKNHANTELAAAEIRARIDAANTSYSLLYSHSDCNDPKLASAAAQLQQWGAALLSPRQQSN